MMIGIVSGKGSIHFPRHTLALSEGDLILNPPHTPFQLFAQKLWSLEFIAIQCNVVVAPMVRENPWLRLNLPRTVSLPDPRMLKEPYHHLRSHHPPPRHLEPFPRNFRLSFSMLLQPMLSWYLMEGFRSKVIEIIRPVPPVLYQTYRAMIKHLNDMDLTIEKLARDVGRSPSQLIQEYSKFYGETPGKTLQKMRVQKATMLLQGNPDISLDHIAHRCGYRDRSSLYRQFKKHVGLSPGEYRKTD